LPYTEAVIAETLRWSSVIPQGIMKTAVKDIEFRGYKIPKGTGFNSFLRAIHHDPEIWGDPDNFRPERFIDERGQFIKHDSFLPFSYGKRPCFGERTAKDELLLVTSSLIQRFEIHVNPDEPNPSLQPTFLLLTAPLPFKVVVYERRKSQSATNHSDHKSKELP
jgi:cytochrome P450